MQRHMRKSEYTYEEKKIILDYIMKTKCYSSLRGNMFWKEMEEKKIVNRTWQSVKEHFRKKIIENIHTFPIPRQERERIKEGWTVSRAPAYKRKKPKRLRHAVDNKFIDEGSEKSENYVISDASDSETIKTRRENTRKNKEGTSNLRIPMPKNLFSDEEDEKRNNETRNEDVSSHDSPDLLNMDRDDRSTPDININEIIVTVSDEEDSNDVTIMPVEIDVDTIKREEAASFSLDEDILLINYMKRDKTYLERKDRLKVFEIFHEIYPDSKPPELLRRRFLLHILPNICNYSNLSYNEMIKIYDDAHMDIPQNLINFLKNAGRYEEISTINEKNNSKLFSDMDIPQNFTNLLENANRYKEISVIMKENECPTSACENSEVPSGVEVLQNSMEDTERNEVISVTHEENKLSMEISRNLSKLMENADLNEGILIINEDNNRVEISQDLSNLRENAERSEGVSVINEKNNRPNNCSTSACKKSKIMCIYSHVIINNQSELFVSLPEYGEDVKKILNLLSTKFKISMDHIQYIKFHSVVLLDQIQYIRNLICQKRDSLTPQNITPLNLGPQDIISSLESCLITLDKFDYEISSDSSSSESEENTINTQLFRPTEVSTPEKKFSESVEQKIISEFLFCELPEDLHVEHNYCAQLNIKSENVSIPEMYIKEEINTESENQCLESVPSPNSSTVQRIFTKVVQTQTQNNLNDSENCFYTPILNTQDL